MLIIVNLLIAILSDEYATLNEVKTGLYWSAIIREMPKYAYDKHYGTLSMFPFILSWISFLTIPFYIFVKDRESLESCNRFLWVIVYFPLSLMVLALFIAVNLVLLPLAYLKTVVHKAALFKRYKATTQCQSLFGFLIFGVFLLLIAQIIDAYYFIAHTYN